MRGKQQVRESGHPPFYRQGEQGPKVSQHGGSPVWLFLCCATGTGQSGEWITMQRNSRDTAIRERIRRLSYSTKHIVEFLREAFGDRSERQSALS